jgi:hypothetical protein
LTAPRKVGRRRLGPVSVAAPRLLDTCPRGLLAAARRADEGRGPPAAGPVSAPRVASSKTVDFGSLAAEGRRVRQWTFTAAGHQALRKSGMRLACDDPRRQVPVGASSRPLRRPSPASHLLVAASGRLLIRELRAKGATAEVLVLCLPDLGTAPVRRARDAIRRLGLLSTGANTDGPRRGSPRVDAGTSNRALDLVGRHPFLTPDQPQALLDIDGGAPRRRVRVLVARVGDDARRSNYSRSVWRIGLCWAVGWPQKRPRGATTD